MSQSNILFGRQVELHRHFNMNKLGCCLVWPNNIVHFALHSLIALLLKGGRIETRRVSEIDVVEALDITECHLPSTQGFISNEDRSAWYTLPPATTQKLSWSRAAWPSTTSLSGVDTGLKDMGARISPSTRSRAFSFERKTWKEQSVLSVANQFWHKSQRQRLFWQRPLLCN